MSNISYTSNKFDFVAICEGCYDEFPIINFDKDLEFCDDCSLQNLLQDLKIDTNTYILSIDIGIRHLGLSLLRINDEYDVLNVVWVNLIDITEFNCLPNCVLYHEKTATDWLAHVLHRYYDIFEKASKILIERQPPTGQTHIEQILFCALRDKSVLVHPRSMHCHFYMNGLDYDKRKECSIRLGLKYISKEVLAKFDRAHDITDSILLAVFWCSEMRKNQENEELERLRNEAMEKHNEGLGMSMNDFFDMYRYIPG